ncbi:MAG: peptide deformylase [Candidatus Peribacteraceae bacterium]|nr:peptide deformylase [Candidatus Peribacteraceae bacterium]
MAVLPIQTGTDNPLLRRKTAKAPKVTKAILKLLKDMRETLKKEEGAGLAAPQVGQSLAICLALIDGKVTALINPEILRSGKDADTQEEGCLSLPGLTVAVTRPTDITVRYLDESGREQERCFRDFDARVVQHEMDHLVGRLLTDYVMPPSPASPAAKFVPPLPPPAAS